MIEDSTSDLDCLDSSTFFAIHAMVVSFLNVKRCYISCVKPPNINVSLFRIEE